jgi:hypothetical protein
MIQCKSQPLCLALATLLLAPIGCVVGDDAALNDDLEPTQGQAQGDSSDVSEGIHGDDGAEIVDAVKVAQGELARIQLEGGEIVYSVDIDGPAAGEITILETFEPDADGQIRVRDSSHLSALELYLSVTGDDVDVPQALIDAEPSLAVQDLAAHRGTADRIASVVKGIEPPADAPQEVWYAPTMCAQGTTSAMFADEICTIDDHWTKNFCHNGTWYSVTDETGSTHKAEWSRSRTLACGANGRARHYYKAGGIWYQVINGTIPSGTVYVFTRKGGAKWQRKITHSREASGFVRGASHFYRFPF